jgi:hypothetical protein
MYKVATICRYTTAADQAYVDAEMNKSGCVFQLTGFAFLPTVLGSDANLFSQKVWVMHDWLENA